MTSYPLLARDWADQPRICTCAMDSRPGRCPRHSVSAMPVAGPGRPGRLCAHADLDGAGPHWLEPGEVCYLSGGDPS